MRRAIAVAALAALLPAGCGGGDPGGDPDKYAKDGDAICADYRVAIARLGQPTRLSEIGPYISDAMPVLTRTVARIERLDPPGDLRDAYDEFRDAARQTVDRAKALRDAASRADSDEVQRLLKEASAASQKRKALAESAGLKECASL